MVEKLTIRSTRIDAATRKKRLVSSGTKHRKIYVGPYRLIPGKSRTLAVSEVLKHLEQIRALYAAGMVDVLDGRVPVDIDKLPEVTPRRPVPGIPKPRAPLVDTLDKDTAVGTAVPLTQGGSAETGEVFDKSKTDELDRLDEGLFGDEEEEEEESPPSEPPAEAGEKPAVVTSGRKTRKRRSQR